MRGKGREEGGGGPGADMQGLVGHGEEFPKEKREDGKVLSRGMTWPD